jgi:MIP family channel proteins
MPTLSRRLLAECLGTALLVSVGCGAVMVDGLHDGRLGLVGIAITWASLVATLIYMWGHQSGAQFNPAVTVALWSVGRVPGREVVPHVLAQGLGATLGSAGIVWVLGATAGVGATTTILDPTRTFAVEFVASFLLMGTVAGAGLDERTPRGFAAIAIGLSVGVCVLVAGPLTGASMNPARSFGPALVAGTWTDQWLYWVAPIAGMCVAAQLLAPRVGAPTNAGRDA